MNINTPFSLFNLSENSQAFFWQAKGVEAVLVSLWIKSGGWYETKIKRGTFHFLEHMLAQGTKNYPSYSAVSAKLEDLGISPRNSVGGYFSKYNWKIPKETFSESLSLLADYVFNPLLQDSAIEREGKIIQQEYLDYWDDPLSRFNYSLSKSFFGENHPYTLDALGTKESIENISKKDLQDAHKEYYQLNNIVLGVVGDLDNEYVKEKVKEIFENQNKGKEILLTNDAVADFKKTIVYKEDNIDQANFSLNFPTTGFKEETLEEKYSLLMLSYLFGRSRVSRLSLRMREKEPLSYSIGSSIRYFPRKGIFSVSFASSIGNLKRVIELIKEEIEIIKKEGIPEKEFKSCQKDSIYQVSLGFDTIYSIIDGLMNSLGYKNKIILPEDKKEAIFKITKEDLFKKAKEIFDFNKAVIGFMGNKRNIEKIKKNNIDKII